ILARRLDVAATSPDTRESSESSMGPILPDAADSAADTMTVVRAADVIALLDYTAWANRQILAAARAGGPETFPAPTDVTYRNLRGTLVHTLDVERSWRDRIRGLPEEQWDTALEESG